MKCIRSLAMLGSLLAASAHAQLILEPPPDLLPRLSWLGGCWAAEGGEPGSGEQWMPLAGGTLLGMSRTVRGGKTAEFEFMQIREASDGRLVFIAQPAGQPGTRFISTSVGDDEVVFENAGNDFPQRVIYRLGEGGRLGARIEGLRGGAMRTIRHPLQKVDCGALAAPGRSGVR